MNRVLVGVVIFLCVFAFVAFQTWLVNRLTARRLALAEQEAIRLRSGPVEFPTRPSYTPVQVRLYVGSFVVAMGTFLAGSIWGGLGVEPSGVGLGLVIFAIVLLVARRVARALVGRAAVQRRGSGVAGSGHAG